MTPFLDDGDVQVFVGDSRDVLAELPEKSVHAILTSPPFFGLRDYGTGTWEGGDPDCAHERPTTTMNVGFNERNQGGGEQRQERKSGGQYAGACPKCGAVRVDRQIGLEATPDEWAASLVEVFAACRRVLRDDGSLWVEVGDSYASSGAKGTGGTGKSTLGAASGGNAISEEGQIRSQERQSMARKRFDFGDDVKPKDLIGAPWLLAFALRADGWWLRGAYIWEKPDCLSGGTRVYASTQKGEMPMTVKDLARLDPATVKLWNGERWTQMLGIWETSREGALELELRNGERIGCTSGHQWPTNRGLLCADEVRVGDVLETCRLPEPGALRDPAYLPDDEIGWLVGLYLAEGSRSGDCISFAGHVREIDRFDRLRRIAIALDGTARMHREKGNAASVHLYGPAVVGVLDAYVSGKTAHGKHLSPRCWKRSDDFLGAILDGYLEGDGHYDAKNERWRLGFCRNDALACDLRTVAARIGASLRLKRNRTGWYGNLRYAPRQHPNARHDGEVVAIRRSRARKFWDISVADAPNTFALASGVVTHNCMPESTRDRCTTSHSYVFHFAKSARYFFDRDAIREPFSDYSTGGDGGSYGGNADDVRPANGRGPRGSTTYVRNRGGVPDGQVTLDGQEPEQEVVGADGRTVTTRTTGSRSHDNYGEFGHDEGRERWPSLEGRSPRSVWRITTEANSFGLCPACHRYWPERAPARHCDVDVVAHFAVWPHRLVERIVACSTSEAGVCGDCGAPRRRTTELDLDLERPQARRALELAEAGNLTAAHIAAVRAVGISDGGRAKLIQSGTGRNDADVQVLADEAKAVLGGYCREFLLGKPSTTGWAPTCECAATTVPATVLDPFGGSGTTARQARKMGRRCVLVELSPDYAEIAAHRLNQLALPLAIA